MMNPSSNNGASTSWLFSGPNSGGGFHTPDHLGHGVHPGNQPPLPPTSNATFTPTSAFEDGRGGPQPAMIVPFSQTDLNFVDSLSIHQPSQQKNQQQQQTQHFVTSSTLHPSSLSVVEATDATGTFKIVLYYYSPSHELLFFNGLLSSLMVKEVYLWVNA